MIQPSHDTPPVPPRTRYSADERARMRADTLALLTIGMEAAATRAVTPMPPPAPDEARALLDGLKHGLVQAHAAFAAGGPQAMQGAARFCCDALRLHRACHRARCRKAHTCRGNAAACLEQAGVPEPVREWVTRLMVAELAPWLPRLGGHAEGRLAYECWVAGIEARRSGP
ncbi:MAG: hypothetical protein E6G97_00810 [Alphaproteobacteria bacterium]|nr:MAG: hypothetical protein E6G97_00810 [Alphaproteobacteria bacterium]